MESLRDGRRGLRFQRVYTHSNLLLDTFPIDEEISKGMLYCIMEIALGARSTVVMSHFPV